MSLYPHLFHPILVLNEVIMVLPNFLNFFAMVLEFSITRRVGTEWTDNFNCHSIPHLFQPILTWNESIMVFLNFLNFFANFLEFSIVGQVGMERNETIICIFSPARPFPSNFCLKRTHNCFFSNFLNFFCDFLWIFYYASDWNQTEW